MFGEKNAKAGPGAVKYTFEKKNPNLTSEYCGGFSGLV